MKTNFMTTAVLLFAALTPALTYSATTATPTTTKPIVLEVQWTTKAYRVDIKGKTRTVSFGTCVQFIDKNRGYWYTTGSTSDLDKMSGEWWRVEESSQLVMHGGNADANGAGIMNGLNSHFGTVSWQIWTHEGSAVPLDGGYFFTGTMTTQGKTCDPR